MTAPSDATIATRTLFEDNRAVGKTVRRFALEATAPKGVKTEQSFAGMTVRVGSRQGNDLVVDDTALSRIHFEISCDDAGFRLRDLGSSNGTTVDGYRSNDIYLRPGSRIVAGETEVIFRPLDEETAIPLSTRDHFGPLLGTSAAMRELFATLQRVARTDFTVLIEGETGTGKELVARAVHEASSRHENGLVVFDAAAVPEHLIESHLFGHEKGTFTGAETTRVGVVEEADEGTLFIDELGELPLHMQPKLLRVLEQREVCRLGSHTVRPVDVRIVAATNRDLASEVNDGTFRDDLYYRLAVVRVVLPPLRKRREDIRALVEHFIGLVVRDTARARAIIDRIDTATWTKLSSYAWPGNVRQLRNVVECGLALAGPNEQPEFDVMRRGGPPLLGGKQSAEPDLSRTYVEQRDELLSQFDRTYLFGILERHDNNISQAAKAAGLDRAYFRRLLGKYR